MIRRVKFNGEEYMPADKVDELLVSMLEEIDFARGPHSLGFGHATNVIEALIKSVDTEEDPSPYCQWCGAMDAADCKCGPIAEND